MLLEFAILTQLSQLPHGSVVGDLESSAFVQLRLFAIILAVEVLPEPLGPVVYSLNFLSTYQYDAEANEKFYKYINLIDSIRGANYVEVFGELDK